MSAEIHQHLQPAQACHQTPWLAPLQVPPLPILFIQPVSWNFPTTSKSESAFVSFLVKQVEEEKKYLRAICEFPATKNLVCFSSMAKKICECMLYAHKCLKTKQLVPSGSEIISFCNAAYGGK